MVGNLRIGAGAALVILGAVLSALSASDRTAAREPPTPIGPLLSASETVVGERLAYPSGAQAKVTAAVVVLAPGEETGWHTHGMPVLGYVLEGVLDVDYGEKGVRTYRAGDAMLEAIDITHNGRNNGAGPVRILAVFMGAEGLTPTHSVAAPPRASP